MVLSLPDLLITNDVFNCAEDSAMLKQLHAYKTENPQERGLIEGEENVRLSLLSLLVQYVRVLHYYLLFILQTTMMTADYQLNCTILLQNITDYVFSL